MTKQDEKDINDVAQKLGAMASNHKEPRERMETLLRCVLLYSMASSGPKAQGRILEASRGLNEAIMQELGGEETWVSPRTYDTDPEVSSVMLAGARLACLKHGVLKDLPVVKDWLDFSIEVLNESVNLVGAA
jgi:hypothetical protein